MTAEELQKIETVAGASRFVVSQYATALIREVRRLQRYEAELERVRALVQERHPMGKAMHIGLLNTAEAVKNLLGLTQHGKDGDQ